LTAAARRTGLTALSTGAETVAAHVGLEVPDLDMARQFYCDLLGFEEVARLRSAGEMLKRLVGAEDASVESVMLRVPGGIHIELQRYTPQGTVGGNSVNNQGLTHVCFAVEDVRAEFERLSAAGVRFAGEPIDVVLDGHPIDGHTIAYLEDPWGLPIELMGPTIPRG
jgi:catechol 2,3-dioxygenase-like lactoylglutathione lyase family enzyme